MGSMKGFSLLLTCLVTRLTGVSAVDDTVERSLLLEFFHATGGPSWNDNSGWEDGVTSDYCNWYGVICVGEADLDLFTNNHNRALTEFVLNDSDETYKVIGLDLSDNFLNGRTPASLWKLPLLQYLNVNVNANLIVDFGQVSEATQLSIVKLQHTATSSVAGLGRASLTLTVLHLTGCPLRSQLPQEVLALTNLRDLQLARCQLQGTLDGLEKLTNLRELNLFDNALKGAIPSTFTQLTRLQKISVSRNQLTGNLAVADAWTNLQDVYLAENQFQGPIPALSAIPMLQRVFLNQNSLDGTIPDDFMAGVLDNDANYDRDAATMVVDLSRNQLTGEIPGTLAVLGDFSVMLVLHDNKFSNISQDLCQEDTSYWNDGAVADYLCDGLVCPPGTYSEMGYATEEHPCRECESAKYYGATTCVQESDKSALLELYQATDGDNWANNSGWEYAAKNLDDWDVDDICTWYGVECWDDAVDTDDAGTGRVRIISLAENNLNGILPEDLFMMEYLNTLNVARNPKLTVPMTMMGMSSKMRYLDISQTATVNFDGIELAPSWFDSLVADGLSLGGTIPNQILNITSLEYLSLAECQLIGTLPTQFGNMKNLNELYLYENHLRGTIPTEFGNMKMLKTISLARNQLTGTLPHTLDTMTNLEAFSIADQVSKGGGIAGPLNPFRFHPSLKSLHLSKNQLDGTLPVELLEGTESLENVLRVDVANNHLTGVVPGALARFQHMDIQLEGNHFSGLDEQLCKNFDWMNGLVAAFGCNAILCPLGTAGGRQRFASAPCHACTNSGDSPGSSWMGQEQCHEGFSMEDTDEQGLLELLFRHTTGDQWVNNANWLLQKKVSDGSAVHICDWFGISCDESKSVVGITLGSNNLQGTFPTEIFMLPKLEALSLFGNSKLTFSMQGIESAQALRSLILDNTGLKSIAGIGAARSLTELNIQSNLMEGALPEELNRLVNLKSLSVSRNSFDGPVPYWLNNLPALESFLGSNNYFTQQLPDLASLSKITYIDLSNNYISGEIPLTFLKSVPAKDKIVVDLSNNKIGGTVPRELARLERMTIHLKNNQINEIDRELCAVEGWNDYDVQKFGCNGILCPVGTSSLNGRQTDAAAACTDCPEATYMGSTACNNTDSHSGAPRWSGLWSLAAVVGVLSTAFAVMV